MMLCRNSDDITRPLKRCRTIPLPPPLTLGEPALICIDEDKERQTTINSPLSPSNKTYGLSARTLHPSHPSFTSPHTYSPTSRIYYSPFSPAYPMTPTGYLDRGPQSPYYYTPTSPAYSPTSPAYSPESPAYSPASPNDTTDVTFVEQKAVGGSVDEKFKDAEKNGNIITVVD